MSDVNKLDLTSTEPPTPRSAEDHRESALSYLHSVESRLGDETMDVDAAKVWTMLAQAHATMAVAVQLAAQDDPSGAPS